MIVYKYSNFSLELQVLVQSPSLCGRSVVWSLHRERIRLSHDQLHSWGDAHQPRGPVDHEVSLAAHQYFIGDLPVRAFISVHCSQLELKKHNTNLVRISLPRCWLPRTQRPDFEAEATTKWDQYATESTASVLWHWVMAGINVVILWLCSEQFFVFFLILKPVFILIKWWWVGKV